MTRPVPWLALALVLLAWPPATAGAEPLTWDDGVREAAANNPDLAAAREAVRVAGLQHRISYSTFYPQLSLDAEQSVTRHGNSEFSEGAGGNVGLSLRQSLFSGFRNRAAVRRASADVEFAEANLLAVKTELSFDLKSAFTGILFSQEQLKLTGAIAERRKQNVRLVQLRYDAGREHQGSLLRSQASSQQAAFEVAQARRALSVARRQLARVLGRRDSADLMVTGDFAVTPPAGTPDFQALVAQTPAHLQPAARVRAAEAGVTIATGQLYPEIAAVGSFSLKGDRPRDDAWSTGVVLSMPLFAGGANIYNVQAAKAASRQSLENLKSANDQVVLELEQTFADFQDSLGNATVQEEFVRTANVRAEIGQNLYTNGLLSFEDWDLIENDLIAAQKNQIRSLRDLVVAEAAWEQTQGKGAIP